MATAPTTTDVERAILDAVKTYNVRAGHTVPMMGVYMKVQKATGATMEEYGKALEEMQAKGLIEGTSSSTFFKLTDAGYSSM